MRWAAQLPEELVVEILSRLPVKPLLRFRCVSKPWRSLIDSSSFVKLHMSKSRNSKISVFGNREFGRENKVETKLTFAEVDLVNSSDGILVQTLILPLVSRRQTVFPAGSCEGLFCFATLDYKEFYLINPSTREYRLLPPPIRTSTRSRSHQFLASGLGYDRYGDEYKFVLISRSGSKVKIYGSKSKAWRQKDVSSNYKSRLYSGYGEYAHGALHWKARNDGQFYAKTNGVLIVAFDLVTEELTVSEYDTDLFGNPSDIALEVLGGQLCLRCKHICEEGFVMDIWVMKEYGVKESWSKLGSFDKDVTPLAFPNCGSRLLFGMFKLWPCGCNFHWYDLNKKSMECIDFWEHSYHQACIQSLIRLEGKLCLA